MSRCEKIKYSQTYNKYLLFKLILMKLSENTQLGKLF
jgi:hypothetical protein